MHIAPLGWEFDRIVLPIRHMHAHRAYLLCRPESDPQRTHFLSKVRSALDELGVEVIHRDVDSNLDTEGMVREMSAIIQYEQGEGSSVHINISGAGKVAAVSAQLAASAHLSLETGSLYYPVPDRYTKPGNDRQRHGLAAGLDGEPKEVPFFRLAIPQRDCRFVLQQLAQAPRGDMRYSEAIEQLKRAGFQGYSLEPRPGGDRGRQRNRANVALYKKVIEKLRSSKYVEVEAQGRERIIHLTAAGRYMAMLCAPPLKSPTSTI